MELAQFRDYRVNVYVHDIFEAIRRIDNFLVALIFEEFSMDNKTVRRYIRL